MSQINDKKRLLLNYHPFTSALSLKGTLIEHSLCVRKCNSTEFHIATESAIFRHPGWSTNIHFPARRIRLRQSPLAELRYPFTDTSSRQLRTRRKRRKRANVSRQMDRGETRREAHIRLTAPAPLSYRFPRISGIQLSCMEM